MQRGDCLHRCPHTAFPISRVFHRPRRRLRQDTVWRPRRQDRLIALSRPASHPIPLRAHRQRPTPVPLLRHRTVPVSTRESHGSDRPAIPGPKYAFSLSGSAANTRSLKARRSCRTCGRPTPTARSPRQVRLSLTAHRNSRFNARGSAVSRETRSPQPPEPGRSIGRENLAPIASTCLSQRPTRWANRRYRTTLLGSGCPLSQTRDAGRRAREGFASNRTSSRSIRLAGPLAIPDRKRKSRRTEKLEQNPFTHLVPRDAAPPRGAMEVRFVGTF